MLFMDGGNIVEENTPQEFFTNPKSPRLQEFLSKVLGKMLKRNGTEIRNDHNIFVYDCKK